MMRIISNSRYVVAVSYGLKLFSTCLNSIFNATEASYCCHQCIRGVGQEYDNMLESLLALDN